MATIPDPRRPGAPNAGKPGPDASRREVDIASVARAFGLDSEEAEALQPLDDDDMMEPLDPDQVANGALPAYVEALDKAVASDLSEVVASQSGTGWERPTPNDSTITAEAVIAAMAGDSRPSPMGKPMLRTTPAANVPRVTPGALADEFAASGTSEYAAIVSYAGDAMMFDPVSEEISVAEANLGNDSCVSGRGIPVTPMDDAEFDDEVANIHPLGVFNECIRAMRMMSSIAVTPLDPAEFLFRR